VLNDSDIQITPLKAQLECYSKPRIKEKY